MDKLFKANFIIELRYSIWLANVVMDKKANDKQRISTDYTNLNEACRKGTYHVLDVDRLVDGTSKFHVLRCLEAYLRYKHIKIHTPDEEKTTFITKDANFCYKVMSFGL